MEIIAFILWLLGGIIGYIDGRVLGHVCPPKKKEHEKRDDLST
jgi:hypothetical protein